MNSDSGNNNISPPTSVDSSLQTRKRVRYVLPLGCIIGGSYEIEKPLGRGGMGEVYLARHIKLDIHRAIKILLPKVVAANPVFADRFMREAKLAIQLQHPNIINVMDAEFDEKLSIYYIVMEFVDGGTVRNIIRKNGAFGEREALEIALRVGEALTAAENLKIVHRDIKPDNIMLTRENTVKLADLGIAKSTADGNEPSMTMPEVLIGTPAYVAPEQAKDAQSVDCRADLYSLGVSLYEMLTAEKPYKGKNTVEVLEQIFNAPVPDIREKCPGISGDTAALIRKMMDKDRERRPRNWMEFCRTVSEILQGKAASGDRAETVSIPRKSVIPAVRDRRAAASGSKFRKVVRYAVPSMLGIGISMLFLSGFLSPGALTAWKEKTTLFLMPGKYRALCEQYHLSPPVGFLFMRDGVKEVWINQNKPETEPLQQSISVQPGSSGEKQAVPDAGEYNGRGTLFFETVATPEVEAWLKGKEDKLEISGDRIGKMTVSLPGSLEVPAGKYRISLSLPECRAFPDIPVDLKQDGQLRIKVDAVPIDATVKLDCNQPDFRVWMDGEWRNAKELRIPSLQNFDLVIRAAGYRTFTSTVKLRPGEIRNMSVVLSPMPKDDSGDSQAMKEANAAYERKNYATAKKFYLEEAEKDNPFACFRLGEIYEGGYGEWFANKEKAYRYYRMAADRDFPPALYKVGEFHEHGLGNVPKNEEEALKWYRRGAEQEQIGCLNRIGDFYENGRAGLSRNPETAMAYYQRGAAEKNPDSQYSLARIFEWQILNETSQKNRDALRKQARYWYEEAARNGSWEAREKLKSL